ncbi:hypothetical protein EJ110_NYTH51622 [Nymphaea thermarum]|nr:hypothetical protein EJ110_NYTH51622 [Nymphaea thermarum]
MASKLVDEEDLVMNIISGLPTDEYGTLKVSLRTRVEPINLEELYSLLLIQESEISKPGNVEDPSAYVAHRQSFKNPNYRGRNEQQKRRSGIKMSVAMPAEIVATLLLNVEPYVKLAGNLDMLLKVCVPLVKVLRLADSEDRPSIGAMDKSKEAIRDNLKGKKKLYMLI